MLNLKLVAAAALLPLAALSAHAAPWTYGGDTGVDHWHTLHEDFGICDTGVHQSPVNITNTIDADLPPLTLTGETEITSVENKGYTVQYNFETGSEMSLRGNTFGLAQVHFHVPAEYQVDGESFPMDAHFVHADADRNLAVIGLLFKEGDANPVLADMWSGLSDDSALEDVDWQALLPTDRDYYYFSGSLTTPPCSEGVRWVVMKEPVEASAEQITTLRGLINEDNARPLQELNARVILH